MGGLPSAAAAGTPLSADSFWLLRGKAYLKKKVATLSGLEVAALPYNEELVEDLRRQRKAGRSIWLCTGANR